MKLCVRYRINPTEEQVEILSELSFFATKLYNTDNYMRRDVWKKTGKIPNWYEQKKILKDNHWYKLLPSQTSQAIVKNLQDNYVSWFKKRKTDPTANPPMFRKKTRLSPLCFYQYFSLDGKKLTVSMSKKYRKERGMDKLIFDISLWKSIEKGIAKMCNILYDRGKWMAHIVYEIPEVPINQTPEIMAVDLGIINLFGTADTMGNSAIYTGKQALASQHYFSKEIAKVQSKTMKQHNKKCSKAIINMHRKKSAQINQIIHTQTKRIIEDAKQKKVGLIVVGDIKNIRVNKDWGHKGNQKLHSWAFAKSLNQLEYKAKLAGIRFDKISERDTSKTCSKCGIVKKSNRKHRGLYRCKCGNQMNADINGATNILQRYLRENNISRSIGSVAEPLIWRVENVLPS
jgi:putative transposase